MITIDKKIRKKASKLIKGVNEEDKLPDKNQWKILNDYIEYLEYNDTRSTNENCKLKEELTKSNEKLTKSNEKICELEKSNYNTDDKDLIIEELNKKNIELKRKI